MEHKNLPVLRNAFACLCQALLYLHNRLGIKHKDIKPQNILVDGQNSVILTDFGLSTRHQDVRNPVSVDPTGYTKMYAPREAFGTGPRKGWDYDTFSLGCVFLEMASIILGETVEKICTFFKTQDAVVEYSSASAKVGPWIQHLKRVREQTGRRLCSKYLENSSAFDTDDIILDVIVKMMSDDTNGRPDLQQVWETFDRITPPCHLCHPSVRIICELPALQLIFIVVPH